MKTRLIKIKRTRANALEIAVGLLDGIRTDEVEGSSPDWPQVGRGFVIEAPPLQDGYNLRIVHTSNVVEILFDEDGVCRFRTESGSIYEVEERE